MGKESQKIFDPKGYYVEFFSSVEDTRALDYGEIGASNAGKGVIVRVYRSLDYKAKRIQVLSDLPHHLQPRLEHILKVGEFKISGLKKKTIPDFLKEVRNGIEKIAMSQKK